MLSCLTISWKRLWSLCALPLTRSCLLLSRPLSLNQTHPSPCRAHIAMGTPMAPQLPSSFPIATSVCHGLVECIIVFTHSCSFTRSVWISYVPGSWIASRLCLLDFPRICLLQCFCLCQYPFLNFATLACSAFLLCSAFSCLHSSFACTFCFARSAVQRCHSVSSVHVGTSGSCCLCLL